MRLEKDILKSKLFFIGSKDDLLFYGLRTYPDVTLNIKRIKSINISKKKVTITEEGISEEYFIIFSIKTTHKYKNELNLFFSRIIRGFKTPLSQEKLSTLLNLISLIQFKKISLIGLIGELLFILHVKENIAKAVNAWHASAEDLFDFTFDNSIAEIKTTISFTRRHKINYRQYNALKNNHNVNASYVSIVINNSQKSNSLNDLISLIKSHLIEEVQKTFVEKLSAYEDLFSDQAFFDINSSLNSIQIHNVNLLPIFIETHQSVITDNLNFTVDFNTI